jgi:L-asparaginase type I
MDKKNKLCLIYTGGTIGMQRRNGVLMPPANPADFLRLAPELNDFAPFDFIEAMNKDSTNINHQDWKIIAQCIYDGIQAGYAGFVVAHGTDTMHFTASAVAFALGRNLTVPVVFTGAQTIPEVPHGDARVNLIRAFMVAQTDLAEVAISFGDFVFRGCRAQKKDERKFDAFESPSFYPIGYITEKILLTGLARRRADVLEEHIDFKPYFAGRIAQFSLIPGLEPGLIETVVRSPQCDGIILQSFGAGNVPSQDDYSVVEVISLATSLNKPTIVTSQFPANSTLSTEYATGVAAVMAGAIPTGNMTSSCAAAKFRWVLASVEHDMADGLVRRELKLEEIGRRMQSVYVDEMDTSAAVATRNSHSIEGLEAS